ncbi:MAG: flotillin family protein [Planctomycetes bacterium]|nr:flotillin family protein [Planctomycetota bacterium]
MEAVGFFLAQMNSQALGAMVIALVLFGALFLFFLAKRYKRCPPNRVLVIYGKVRAGTSARCLHGGGAFVWPLIQNYSYLSLDPLQIEIPLSGALSAENIRINVPSVFTVAVGTTDELMQSAAQRLQGLSPTEISQQGRDIIFGQLRQVIASMGIEDINRDRDKFLSKVQSSLEPELNKIGLVLINVNITDITDESGYIEAIGRKAASEAVQSAAIDVALQEKRGAIGVAAAKRDQDISVAQAERDLQVGTTTAQREQAVEVARLAKERAVGEQQAAFERDSQIKVAEREMRVAVANANASAVSGENEAKAVIANANAQLRIKEAEAYQVSEVRKREAEAAVLEAQYKAQARQALAESTKIEAEQRAQLEAAARAIKAKITVDAEAEADARRIHAQGQADARRIEAEAQAQATFVNLEAQARGQFEILRRKAEGLRELVASCGGAQNAFQLMMLEHLDHLAETAASAISNVKFDKIVVWDGGAENGGAAGFVKRMGSMLPPMMNLMKDIGGVQMPEFLGKMVEGEGAGPGAGPSAGAGAGTGAAPPHAGPPPAAPPPQAPPASTGTAPGGAKPGGKGH